MKHTKEILESSCLCEARYDDEERRLTVVYRRNEHETDYLNVPPHVFAELCDVADQKPGAKTVSVGDYYNRFIKGATWTSGESEHERLVVESRRKDDTETE